MSVMASGSHEQRQMQVLLALHDGERSFGMSLAQKSPALGSKYTVVSSVFSNSPADRAGVRKGYVVRCINDKPMGGLTVAEVANHFRNVGQARITLEIVESQASPRASAFTAAATFGGVTTLPNRPATQSGGSSAVELRVTAPLTGFSAVSSGRAIAAPGSALAVPGVAPPKQQVLRLGAKPAAKSAGLQPQSGVVYSVSSKRSTPVPSAADAKTASGETRTGLKSKAVAPVLRLGPKPKPALPEKAEEKVTDTTVRVDSKPAAKSVSEKQSSATATVNQPASSRIPPSPVQAIEAPKSDSKAQVIQAPEKSSVTVAQTKRAAAQSVAPAPPSPKTAPAPAAKAATPITAPSSSVAVKNPVSVPSPLPKKANASAVMVPIGSITLPQSLPTPSAKPSTVVPTTASHSTVPTTCATTQASEASVNSTNPPAQSSSTTPVVAAQPPPAQTRTAAPAPAVHPSEPAAVKARRRRTPSAPAIISPISTTDTTRSTASTPVHTPTRSTMVAQSAPAPAGKAPATKKSGKKRGRPRKNAAASNGTAGSKGKGKAKKSPKHQQESDEDDAMMDDEDIFDLYAFSSESDLDESPSKKAARRTALGRRRGVTDRTRHSLTVDRLVGMGFTQEDAEASVKEIGDDPDACMLRIISKIEERQFTEDLNRASIQSEQSKRDEEKRVKKMEKETLVHAKKFMALFPTSYLVCPESTASRLKELLQSTIDDVNGEAYLREILSKLLTLEGKSIRWYKEASRSYMLELAGRLDSALGTHDVMACCANISANDASSPTGSCAFVRKVLEEVTALTKALFEMPSNQGGVPPVFLECDEATKFDLEDDGFEVVDPNE